MNRRTVLTGLASVGAAGALVGRFGRSTGEIEARIWLSERAASHPDAGRRARGYLDRALRATGRDATVSLADERVSLSTESGRRVYGRRWPRRVVESAVGIDDLDTVRDVNLLVTDGDPRAHPAGFGRPHVAAVGGARFLDRLDPATDAPWTLDYSLGAAAAQLVLHECGHALGLDHDHGHATVRDDTAVASPMVGGYLWADPSVREAQLPEDSACGDEYPVADAGERRALGLRYADCAARAIRGYDGALVP